MKNITLTTLSVFILLLGISTSFTTKAYGKNDVDVAVLQKQLAAMQEMLMQKMGTMEETIKEQQEMINALKEQNRKVAEIPMPNYKDNIDTETSDFQQIIGREIDNYFTKEDTREKLVKAGLAPKLDFGYKKGFYLKTLDDKFSVNLRNRIQFKYEYKDHDWGIEDRSSFNHRRVRTEISGHAYNENMKYRFEWESSSDDVELLDAYVDITHVPWANIWVGQGKVYSRQVLTSGTTLQMIDRSVISDEFSFQGDKRKRGMAIHSDKILEGKIDYLFGVYNPQNRFTDNTINTMLYIARSSYYPFGPYESYKESDLEYTDTFKAHIGGGIGFEQIGANSGANSQSFSFTFDDNRDEVDQTQILGEFGFKYKGLSLVGEYHYRKRMLLDALESGDSGAELGAVSEGAALRDHGLFVQGGYFVVPKKLEIAGRYELFVPDDDYAGLNAAGIAFYDAKTYEAGINYFIHGRDHKVQLNYRSINYDGHYRSLGLGSIHQNEVLMQYQIYF